MGNLCCVREHSVQFFVQFFYTVKLKVYGALYAHYWCNKESTDSTPGVGNFFYLKAEYVYFWEGATRSSSQEISAVHSLLDII
jgi:hypothetical protein